MKKLIKKAAAVILSTVMITLLCAVPPERAPKLVSQISNAMQNTILTADAADSGISLSYWVADNTTGDKGTRLYKGTQSYFCYRLYDKATGNDITSGYDFSITINITSPSGVQKATVTYDTSHSYSSNDVQYTAYKLYVPFIADELGKWNASITMSGGLTLDATYEFSVSVPHVNLRAWVSDTEWGELAGNDRLVGERFYLCCEITDLNTGKQLDSRVSGYSVTLTIYKPDGTVQHTVTRDETSNLRTHDWISTICNDAGKWQGKVTITGDFEVECNVSWTVNDPDAPEAAVTDDDVTLDFKWGTDNWSFSNTNDYFPNGYYVDDEMIDKLADEFKFTNIEREIMKVKGKSQFSAKWGGSCFGLSLSEILSKQGDIDLSKYGGKSTVNANTNSSEMLSMINFMQLLQNIPRYSQISRLNGMEKIPETVSQDKIISKRRSAHSRTTVSCLC